LKPRVLALLVLLVLTAPLILARTTSAQDYTWTQGYLGPNLYFKIRAPLEARINSTVVVELALQVYESSLSVVKVAAWIYNCGVDEHYTLLRSELLGAGAQRVFNLTVAPREEGYLKLALEVEYYSTSSARYHYSYVSATITAIRATTYQELYERHTELLREHSELSREYSALRERYEHLYENYTLLLNLYENLTSAYSNLSENFHSLYSEITQLLKSTNPSVTQVKTHTQQASAPSPALIAAVLVGLMAIITKPWRILGSRKKYWWFTNISE